MFPIVVDIEQFLKDVEIVKDGEKMTEEQKNIVRSILRLDYPYIINNRILYSPLDVICHVFGVDEVVSVNVFRKLRQ